MLKSLWRAVFPRRADSVPDRFIRLGEHAYQRVLEITDLGPRHSGSDGHRQLQMMITAHLSRLNCTVEHVPFVADTPVGPIEMMNIIARFPGRGQRVRLLSGHYDTLRPELVRPPGRKARAMKLWMRCLGSSNAANQDLTYLGANDGGSSTALLLELASLVHETEMNDVWIVFFDGEECVRAWSGQDHTYGSRHQVAQWKQGGELERIAALINVDIIGAENLECLYELNSTLWLREEIWKLAEVLGYAAYFPTKHARHIGDDHVPFVQAGVPALNIIDAEYGPGNGYWHTCEDSPDKLSPRSFAVVGHLLSEALRSFPHSTRP